VKKVPCLLAGVVSAVVLVTLGGPPGTATAVAPAASDGSSFGPAGRADQPADQAAEDQHERAWLKCCGLFFLASCW
jgi:hypothetical protein